MTGGDVKDRLMRMDPFNARTTLFAFFEVSTPTGRSLRRTAKMANVSVLYDLGIREPLMWRVPSLPSLPQPTMLSVVIRRTINIDAGRTAWWTTQ